MDNQNQSRLLLNYIKAPVYREFREYEARFQEVLKSPVPMIREILSYLGKKKGKQLRPLLLLLSAKSCGRITDATYLAAVVVELLHTATLVHDDVVDDSLLRRGMPSVKALWQNKISVLIGDYLLSRCILLGVNHHEYTLIRIISRCIKKIIEGEMLQLKSLKRIDTSEKIYLNIVNGKTAALISACCELGAVSVTTDYALCRKLSLFGIYLGISFQIRDDLFSFDGRQGSGKPDDLDIMEGNVTLPLIFALENSPLSESRIINKMITKPRKDKADVDRIVEFVHRWGGAAYAGKVMGDYARKAHRILSSLVESESKRALKRMAEYLINRDV